MVGSNDCHGAADGLPGRLLRASRRCERTRRRRAGAADGRKRFELTWGKIQFAPEERQWHALTTLSTRTGTSSSRSTYGINIWIANSAIGRRASSRAKTAGNGSL